jgi:hypothetical protein
MRQLLTLVVKGFTAQSADLMQWQNSSSTILAYVTSAGTIRANDFRPQLGYRYYSVAATSYAMYEGGSPNTLLASSNSGYIPLVVRGAISQTANLQQWQNSSATVLAYLNSSGSMLASVFQTLTNGRYYSATSSSYAMNDTPANGDLNFFQTRSDTQVNTTLRSFSATATANLLEVRSGGGMGGNLLTSIKPSGRIEVVNDAAASVVLIAKGAAAQSADLQQWQDSSAVVKANIKSTGALYRQGANTWDEFLVSYVTGDSVYRWIVDVTGKMMWDNGSGGMTSGPYIGLDATPMQLNIQGWGLVILNNGTGQVVTTVRGYSGQTASLQEWQDSASAVKASVSAAGLGLFAGLSITDAKDITLGTTTGTKIGTATTQKLGFYNATPIVQGAAIADPTGGATVDAEARTAINDLISRLEALGLIATV